VGDGGLSLFFVFFITKTQNKMKYSNFHVTVNFNVDAEDHIREFREAIENMATSEVLWGWLRQYDGGEQLEFDEANKPLVDRVRLRAAFEHGGQQNHGLHAHIVIEIAHTTMVQINKSALVTHFANAVGLAPNIHCRFIKGNGEDKDFILFYLTKEIPNYRPENARNAQLQRAFEQGEIIDANNNDPEGWPMEQEPVRPRGRFREVDELLKYASKHPARARR